MDQLDPKSLVSVLAEMEKRSKRPEVRERRAFERFVVRTQGTLSVDPNWQEEGSGSPAPVYVRDMGRGGVGLLCRAPMPTGRTYRLVCVEGGVELFSTPVVTRHVTKVAPGVWSMGAMFVAEAAWLASLGIRATDIRRAEEGLPSMGGEFSAAA